MPYAMDMGVSAPAARLGPLTLRGGPDQADDAGAVGKPEESSGVGPAGTDPSGGPRYISPVFDYLSDAGRVVMMYRDSVSGEVVEQFPPKTVLRTYEEALRRQERSGDGNGALVFPAGFPEPDLRAPPAEEGAGGDGDGLSAPGADLPVPAAGAGLTPQNGTARVDLVI